MDSRRRTFFVTLAMLAGLQVFMAGAESADLPQYDRTRILQEGRPITDVQLTNQHGDLFSLSELQGQVAFIFFGFTNCPDVCPMTMAKFRQFEDSDSVGPDDIAYVLISVDGERDTPAAMKTFLEPFSERIIGLTAEPARVKKIAREFRASFFKGSPSADDGGYSIAHSPQVFVLDREGLLRAEMYDPPVQTMAGIANALLTSESNARLSD